MSEKLIRVRRETMKTLKIMIAGLSIFCTVFTACKKENVGGTTATTTPNLSDKGGIIFKIKDSNSNALANAMVGLSASSTDLINKSYVSSRTTDVGGVADMGKVTGGIYYYEVNVSYGGSNHHVQGSIQAINGQDTTQELKID